MNLESQDQAKQNQEAKEEQDRQDYQSSLTDFEGGLQDCIKTALEDGIEIDDVIEAMQNALWDNISSNDGIITIKRVRF